MTKFEKKLDALFWFLVGVLPLVIFFVINYRNSSADFSAFISAYRYDYVADICTQIFTDTLSFPVVVTDFLSYFVSVEISHIFIDVIVFIPRFARTFLEGCYDKIQK